MRTLKIKRYQANDWTCADKKDRLAFEHFCAGYLAIPNERLEELEAVAEMHGWKVEKV